MSRSFDLELDAVLTGETHAEARRRGRRAAGQGDPADGQGLPAVPLLSGPSALPTLADNITANLTRNVWAHMVIFCGHFPAGAETFTEEQIEAETRAQWYVRQLLGSANIDGGALFHVLSGNLSHQIEHHLFPDLPSNRYAEIAPKVRTLCARYGLPYTPGRLTRQYASAWKRILRLALPTPGRRNERTTKPGTQPMQSDMVA